ncbi:MAG: hypothetical protein GY845_17180 [Planctomycetes bacterium]|nr:hypothetical protein [Planctomycetota bacterium]
MRRADAVDARKGTDFELVNSMSCPDAADALSPQADARTFSLDRALALKQAISNYN